MEALEGAGEGLILRWVIWTPILWVFFTIASHIYAVVEDTRTYRDIAATIPFRNVELTALAADAAGVTLEGTMIKTRGECLYADLRAYMSDAAGVEHEVPLDTSGEAFTGTRPAMSFPQAWGSWVLRFPAQGSFIPKRWCLYAAHQCPEDRQTNEFLCGRVPNVIHPLY